MGRKYTCNKKSQISLLSTFAIHFHFSDLFPHISRRLNFADRKFCDTSQEKPKSQKRWNKIQAKTNSFKVVTPIFSSKVGQTKIPFNKQWFNCGANYSTCTRFAPFSNLPVSFYFTINSSMYPTSYGLYHMQLYKYIAGLQYFSFPIIQICIPAFYLGKYSPSRNYLKI